MEYVLKHGLYDVYQTTTLTIPGVQEYRWHGTSDNIVRLRV